MVEAIHPGVKAIALDGCEEFEKELILPSARLILPRVAAGYAEANDCDVLLDDPAFKMAVGRLPETGAELCS
jgi:hypothetical protein